ncbi:dihydrolipoamide acetyltransferase family protein [Zhihengliuella salsuginis]|uniref:Dihydrolipoamide acetyltransferase component of pyruvate dehydrogenase complex n=1 Tax=Zhihengliuella salsuginis TaxID=578222 RepID=A0ABQ3GG29_9MICC|nr:dihydrolipoamide acetyltransferase family protein [Zhihengliuella salsuginis]GHD04962.1 dihydrolipoamide acetyltransferase component of pyruvate dehydrogenase complex [Zhihengliuella salsuginis]
MNIFTLPDVGEGLTEADIVSWKVAVGDAVSVNQVFVEIETAKSLVELPCPFAGTVAELHAAEGETLEVGKPLITIDEAAVPAEPQAPDAGRPLPEDPAAQSILGEVTEHSLDDEGEDYDDGAAPAADRSPAAPAEEGVGPLVGSGPKADPARRRRRLDRPTPSTAVREGLKGARERLTPRAPAATAGAVQSRVAASGAAVSGLLGRVLAKPPVRKFAKELGIDLAKVPATGGQGEITREDLLSYQAQREAEQDAAPTFWNSKAGRDDRIDRQAVKGVRKATAKAMVDSAFSAPHVSIFVDVDATRTMEFVQRLKKSKDFEGVKVSPLLILAKAVIWAAARNPNVNASWVETENGAEIQVKHFMNLGIAAATPRGLLVPNIKDAQDLSLKELAIQLNELASTARAGRTSPAEMKDGTLTVTNIGALGIDTGTPIINPGEVAIVAFGTIKQKPWVVSGEVIPRWITTLGGSFDHRVVDGDLSARFMADVAAIMEEPALLLD